MIRALTNEKQNQHAKSFKYVSTVLNIRLVDHNRPKNACSTAITFIPFSLRPSSVRVHFSIDVLAISWHVEARECYNISPTGDTVGKVVQSKTDPALLAEAQTSAWPHQDGPWLALTDDALWTAGS